MFTKIWRKLRKKHGRDRIRLPGEEEKQSEGTLSEKTEKKIAKI